MFLLQQTIEQRIPAGVLRHSAQVATRPREPDDIMLQPYVRTGRPALPHDQLWKQLLWAFFQDFMVLFFEDVARELDFEKAELLDKEQFTDLPTGKRRELDLVVKVRTKDGNPEIVLIHVEVERKRRAAMARRMWEYYSLLRLRHRLPVFPVVVYLSPGAGGANEETFEETLFGRCVHRFCYAAIGLPDLPAERYLESPIILGPALSALMRSSGMSRVEHKLRALGRLARAGIDEARQSLLAHVVGTYMELSSSEERDFERLMSDPSHEEAREMVNIFEQRGIQKGIEQGIERGIEQGIEKGIERGVAEGLLQGQRRVLVNLLQRRFGRITSEVASRIEAITDSGRLDELATRVLDAASLEEMGI